MKERFAYLLRESLKAMYGKVPSAETVARHFNLRAYDTSPVTQESVRRWIRGECLPKADHLLLLVSWLEIDLNQTGPDVSADAICKKPVTSGSQAIQQSREQEESENKVVLDVESHDLYDKAQNKKVFGKSLVKSLAVSSVMCLGGIANVTSWSNHSK